MTGWQKVKINSFLKERESRIKPAEANKMGLKRLNKIDFSGKMHLLEKPTNTDMILIKKGDLVISGINVEKGAVAVYQGEEDILATIHYSAYIFDETKIDIEYFKTFLKSKAFREIINTQIRSGIKTELKAKKFLPLEINLPDLKTQIGIRNKINLASNEISELDSINDKNESYISKLHQSILQEAVQGKLVKQDPKDEPASELLKKIKAEKEKLIREGKIRKEKPLAPISENEIPYELPIGWIWVKLGEIFKTSTGGTPSRSMPSYYGGNIPWLKSGELNDSLKINKSEEFITESGLKDSSAKIFKKGSLLLALYGATAGKLGILDFDATTNQAVCNFEYNKFVDNMYLFYFLRSIREKILSEGFGGAQPNISQDYVKNLEFPLPPLAEQKRIVERVDKLMAYCDELEKQVKENQMNSEKLMQAVLKESFKK
jgi:type I restriction enzyme S subunit